MIRHKLFDGVEKPMIVYNRQAIINRSIEFFTEECDNDLEEEEEDFAFPSYDSAYMYVYNERLGTLIKSLSLSHSDGALIINASASDMTFEDNGNYYYEVGYTQTGGYQVALMYGILKVV